MIGCKYKGTGELVHWFFSRQTHRCNLFTKLSNKDISKRLDFLYDHSLTAMVYIYLETSTQALSPFWTIIVITVIRYQLHLAKCYFSTPFLDSSRISSAIQFSWKSIDSPLLSLLASFTWAWQTLVWRTLPSSVSLILLQILISPRNGSTKSLVIE